MINNGEGKRLGKKKQLRLMTFLLALFTATLMFLPYVLRGHGYFIFFGDFNVQQIPFYRYCHDMVRSGNIGWDFMTDLGANFIGSYSFYLLGSPFFWLTLPFPGSFVPYLMAPLLILKFACAALTAYLYIRRFTSRAETAMIGGLLYAFSGFSIYNIFFNHFHEAIVFFPLLLLALESFIGERRRGVLALAVFACALVNYYFFFGMVLFVVIYWFVRVLSGSFKFSIKEFFLMLLECVIGLLLTAAILLPTVYTVFQNSRTSEFIVGWPALMYGKEQIFLNVLECFFFPPDLPARPVFFPGADVKWSSLGGWLPLFGMTGVITWLKSQKKGTWLRRLIVIMIFMALVPGLNSAFSMFNASYYARWFYMPILMMCLATCLSIEDTEVDWSSAWRWNFGIVAAATLIIGFSPRGIEDGKITGFGLYTGAATNPIKLLYQLVCRIKDSGQPISGCSYDLRYWVTCSISIICLIIMRIIIPVIKEKRTGFIKPTVALICTASTLYGMFFIGCGMSHSYDIDDVMIDELIEGKLELDIADDEYARIDVYDGVDNTGLYLGYPSVYFFHSIVPGSIMDFYEYIGVHRSVASRPSTEYPAIRSLLSVRYMLDPEIENSKDFADENGNTEMLGYRFVKNENGYDVYENENYIPMGFTYDYYITEEQMENYGGSKKSEMMLRGMLVNTADIPEIRVYLRNIADEYYIGEYVSGKRAISFDAASYNSSCSALASTAGTSFVTGKNGFTSKITLDRNNLVFYSIPYDSGWKAYVNGREAKIYKVNKGFMAVAAEAGSNEIKFVYTVPGLKNGIIISVSALAVYIVYLLFAFAFRYRRRRPDAEEYPEGEQIRVHAELYEAAVYEAEHPENEKLLDDIDPGQINAYQGFAGGFVIDDNVLDSIPDTDQKGDGNDENCD